MTGIRNGAFLMDLDLSKIKAYCKEQGCTVNDYSTALLSNTMYEYFQRREKEYSIPAHIDVGMAFSMRQPEKELRKIKLVNDFAVLPIRIALRKTFQESIPIFKKQFRRLRNSLVANGVKSAFNLSVNLPFTLSKFVLDFFSDKPTLIYSNLFASKVDVELDGKQFKGAWYFVPCVGKICCGISFCTVGSCTSFTCFSDESYIEDP